MVLNEVCVTMVSIMSLVLVQLFENKMSHRQNYKTSVKVIVTI